jgi:geranylgeranyl diphosphate synthase, type II
MMLTFDRGTMLSAAQRDAYLVECRAAAIRYITALVGARERAHPAYRAVLDYPLREAKGLRPAIAIATCRALGGGLDEILPTAAVFELLHNAFLVHDDVEDGSALRRHAPTLAVQLGVPRAVHTGDTMLALALDPMLDNMRLLDLGRALRLLQLIARVMRRTAEGQALELAWIADHHWAITPDEYVDMVTHKTAWYTFAGPIAAGAIVAEAPAAVIDELTAFAIDLGVAFQIRDDILNLRAEAEVTGKERWGDLWEGKRTLILALFFARAAPDEAAFARAVLAKRRPAPSSAPDEQDTLARLDRAMAVLGDRLGRDGRAQLRAAFRDTVRAVDKRADEVARLRSLIDPEIARAANIAAQFATRASERWASIRRTMVASIHRDLIESILEFTITRDR